MHDTTDLELDIIGAEAAVVEVGGGPRGDHLGQGARLEPLPPGALGRAGVQLAHLLQHRHRQARALYQWLND